MTEEHIRDRILREATRLFADRGYGTVSVREVVEAAQVTKPTLYYYFTNKEALFLEAVRRQTQGLRDRVLVAVDGPGSSKDRLRGFIQAHIRWVAENPDGMRLLMTVHHHPDENQPPVDMITVHRENGEILGRVLKEGQARGEVRTDIDVRDAVLALVGMLNLRCAASIHGMALPDDLADRILSLFFHGITA